MSSVRPAEVLIPKRLSETKNYSSKSVILIPLALQNLWITLLNIYFVNLFCRYKLQNTTKRMKIIMEINL